MRQKNINLNLYKLHFKVFKTILPLVWNIKGEKIYFYFNSLANGTLRMLKIQK
jgi:hypothetical protein